MSTIRNYIRAEKEEEEEAEEEEEEEEEKEEEAVQQLNTHHTEESSTCELSGLMGGSCGKFYVEQYITSEV